MPECPLADECPSFTERIEGMGCIHYGDRGGAEWCNHYSQPIRDLKRQPVKVGEEIVVDVTDIHSSGAGVGRTEDGFIVLVDGVLPESRARVKITTVRSNHAKAEEIERLPMTDEAAEEGDGEADGDGDGDGDEGTDGADADDDEGSADADGSERSDGRRERLGSRDNFWGG